MCFILRNSERHTGHEVVKKNKKAGLACSASIVVDCLEPSVSVNAKCGAVFPSSVPVSGRLNASDLVSASVVVADDAVGVSVGK